MVIWCISLLIILYSCRQLCFTSTASWYHISWDLERTKMYTSIGNIDNFINKHYMNCYTCMFYFLQLLSFFIIVYVLIFHNFHTKMGTGRWFENQTFYTDSGLQILFQYIGLFEQYLMYIHFFYISIFLARCTQYNTMW